jgi:hypothetical protein
LGKTTRPSAGEMKSDITTVMALCGVTRAMNSSAFTKSVPRRFGSKNKTSRMTRRTWLRPLRGGMNFSTSSLNRIRPTLSLLRIAENASTEAISAASSRFGLVARAEQAGAAHVHDEHEREFAFLDELLDERMVHPRGDVPVNRAHVVAGLVFAHLVEVHALALEDGMILARERFGHDAVRAQLDLPDFFENLAGNLTARAVHQRFSG